MHFTLLALHKHLGKEYLLGPHNLCRLDTKALEHQGQKYNLH